VAGTSEQELSASLSNKIFLFSFLQGVVNGIWGFLTIFLLDIGGTGLEVGILATVPGVVSTFMQLAWGRISDKLSHSWRMASTGFLFTAIFSIPVILSNRPWQVILAAGVQAFFSSISGIAVVVRLGDLLRPSKRSRFMGIYNPIGFAGTMVGSFISGFMIPAVGYRFTFLNYTLLNLLLGFLVRYGLSGTGEKVFRFHTLMHDGISELNNGLKELPPAIRRGGSYLRWCYGISIRGFGIAMFGPVMTVYLVQVLSISEPQIGVLNSIAFGLRLFLVPILAYFVGEKGPKGIMMIGIMIAAIHPISLMMANDYARLVPVYMISGLSWAFINSSWFTWQMNLIPRERGVYAGYLNFINGLSWAFGPLLGGYLCDVVDLQISAMISTAIVIAGFMILIKVPSEFGEQIISIYESPGDTLPHPATSEQIQIEH